MNSRWKPAAFGLLALCAGAQLLAFFPAPVTAQGNPPSAFQGEVDNPLRPPAEGAFPSPPPTALPAAIAPPPGPATNIPQANLPQANISNVATRPGADQATANQSTPAPQGSPASATPAQPTQPTPAANETASPNADNITSARS